MARTLTVIAPTGMPTPRLTLVDATDVLIETISLTEAATALGRYSGTIATAGAGLYTAVIWSGATSIGSFAGVEVTDVDPSEVFVLETVNDPTVMRLGTRYRHTANGTGADYDLVTITTEP